MLAGNKTAAGSLEEGCQACTEGYYCIDTGNTLATRKICPAGYYCPVGSSGASACPAGSYNEVTGSWSNDDCARECDSSMDKPIQTKQNCRRILLSLTFTLLTVALSAGKYLREIQRRGME